MSTSALMRAQEKRIRYYYAATNVLPASCLLSALHETGQTLRRMPYGLHHPAVPDGGRLCQ